MDDPFTLPDALRSRPPEPDEAHASTARDTGVFAFDLDRQCTPDYAAFSGVRVYRDFFDPHESEQLLREIEESRFVPAQSGKLKQHFGARVNFNKQRVNLSGFEGLPDYVRRIEERLRERLSHPSDDSHPVGDPHPADGALVRTLDGFETTDVFVLRYDARDASNFDLHRDDSFAYGETILDLSLESDSVLTFVRVPERDESCDPPGRLRESAHEGFRDEEWAGAACVRVPLPARSLAVLYGPARFDWEHGILAYDVDGQRTSITLRTLSDTLRETEVGRQLVDIARRGAVAD